MAFGLVTILLSVLFSCFTNAAKLTAKIDAAKAVVAKRDLFYQRTLHVLTKAEGKTIALQNVEDRTNKPLIFTFENGIDHDFSFSGTVSASIDVNAHKELTLTIWSKDQSKEPRIETLLTGIRKVDWEIEKQRILLTVTYSDKKTEVFPFSLPKSSFPELQLKSRLR